MEFLELMPIPMLGTKKILISSILSDYLHVPHKYIKYLHWTVNAPFISYENNRPLLLDKQHNYTILNQ